MIYFSQIRFKKRHFGLFLLLLSTALPATGQHSVARKWNEVLLAAIRKDFARPTIHARNLFHSSVALYDAWAAYDPAAETYLLGKVVHGYEACSLETFPLPADKRAAQEEAMSYAAYRLLRHRFQNSPGAATSLPRFDSLMNALGYDPGNRSVDYQSGSAAALGNYLAQCLIDYGLQDGANEENSYANQFYRPVNPSLIPISPGNPNIRDLNRWQPMTLQVFIDQSGNVIPGASIPFLSPEWGQVAPFALTEQDRSIYLRDGHEYWVYHDPGSPPLIDLVRGGGLADDYKWNFTLVITWAAHLDPADTTMWDISPASLGDAPLPRTPEEMRAFYNLLEGGDIGRGHPLNPHTGKPYEPQWVRRGDYTRVLAEFWADGPDSETPPGHWFTILNYVNDHPEFQRRFEGKGPELDPLEWDVKAYFTLGGAVHDAAVTAWGIKGWYDYVRPISAIRGMSDLGQSSDPTLPRYSPGGLPLIPGYIEMIMPGDSMAGPRNENLHKIKVRSWKGPNYVRDPKKDVAGVDWILAGEWWPYQRPTFVTPPFAGFISGHSTYSRTAAVVLALLTGDEFFPGGLAEFKVPQNEFLVFEDGPSTDLILQWATYRDASDQTSLSRIWGGIHPPVDDIPGRIIGEEIGADAFAFASRYFQGEVISDTSPVVRPPILANLFPNPVQAGTFLTIELEQPARNLSLSCYNMQGQRLRFQPAFQEREKYFFQLDTGNLAPGMYVVQMQGEGWSKAYKVVVE